MLEDKNKREIFDDLQKVLGKSIKYKIGPLVFIGMLNVVIAQVTTQIVILLNKKKADSGG